MSDPSTPVGGEPASPYRAHAEALVEALRERMLKTASGQHVIFDALHVREVIEAALLAAREQGRQEGRAEILSDAQDILDVIEAGKATS